MNQLREYTVDFKTSRPVFSLQLSDNGSTINTSQMIGSYLYRPKPIIGDYLSELICSKYYEQFDLANGCYCINRDRIVDSAMQEIRSSMGIFIEKNLDIKSPRQSKLYRWTYRNMPDNSEFNSTLIMVYKYLRSFCSRDMRGNNNEHVKNGLALLEAIMEKHER